MPISIIIPDSFLYVKTGLLLASVKVLEGKYFLKDKYLPRNSASAYIKKRAITYGYSTARARIRKIR
jgi:hypothetical protein